MSRRVLVTGCSSGIGQATAVRLAGAGYTVYATARKLADLEACQQAGCRCLTLDVTDEDSMVAAVEAVEGGVEVLVNNAANDKRHAVEDVTEEFWDWMQAINLKAYFFAAQAVVPAMKAAGKGTIINFTSISYMMGNAGYPLYTTANAGLNGMTRSLARDLGASNIRVNALAPGWVLTQKQLDLWADPISLASHLERLCLKEHLVPEDIVGGVLFLASDVSRMMTGQTMVIDGGVVVTG